MRRVNGWLTVFWIVMIPVSLITGWISSVTYVAALSLWALVSGHWSAWQAARVEVRQDEEATRADREPVEQRVVDRLVAETTVEPVAGRKRSLLIDGGSTRKPESLRYVISRGRELVEDQQQAAAVGSLPDRRGQVVSSPPGG